MLSTASKIFSSDTFKIFMVGSFTTVIALTICGTIVTVNEDNANMANHQAVKMK